MPRRDGSRLLLDGAVDVGSAGALMHDCAALVRDGVDTIDFGGVDAADSAAVALALALLREARGAGRPLSFLNLPAPMKALAVLYGVADFIPARAG